jgi:multimeric flavodoxin WrbA
MIIMKVIAINGSPRKNGNTATLLQKALDGAAAEGADTELIHLYDLDFKGCRSCFACKMVGGLSEGRCAAKDDATPVFRKIEQEADAVLLGSPIYFAAMSGEMRSFLERLLFAPLVYSKPPRSLFPRKIRTGVIYTMNSNDQMSSERGYPAMFSSTEASLRNILGSAETLCSYDTYQFPDYSKVIMEYMDPAKKAEQRETVFPDDCRKAIELGRRVAGK